MQKQTTQNLMILVYIGISGVIAGGAKGRSAPPGKLNVKTGPPLGDILIFSIL